MYEEKEYSGSAYFPLSVPQYGVFLTSPDVHAVLVEVPVVGFLFLSFTVLYFHLCV